MPCKTDADCSGAFKGCRNDQCTTITGEVFPTILGVVLLCALLYLCCRRTGFTTRTRKNSDELSRQNNHRPKFHDYTSVKEESDPSESRARLILEKRDSEADASVQRRLARASPPVVTTLSGPLQFEVLVDSAKVRDGPESQVAELLDILREGDKVSVTATATDNAGNQRVLTQYGWATEVSSTGRRLLQPTE